MKSNLDSVFKSDKKLEQDGVDFVVKGEDKEAGTPEVSFRLRRIVGTNPKMKAAMAQYYKPYARQIEMGTLPEEKNLELSIRLFIDVSLVSWKGVLDGSGKEIECTKANAYELLRSLPDLFLTLQQYASAFESYKEEVGNS